MDQRTSEQNVDPEILSQSGRILASILEKLGVPPVAQVAPPRPAKRRERALDLEVVNLSGGVFGHLPAEEIPLEDFRLDEPAPLSRPRIDSLAPTAHASVPPQAEPARARRPVPWVLGGVMAAGFAGFVGTGALARSAPSVEPAAAQAVAMSAPEPVVRAEEPSPPAEAPPVATAPAVPVRSAGRRAAPRPATAPPAVADTADLPLVLPPMPPKPQVPFARAAAAVAIADGGLRAASCRQAGAGSTAVPVSVTFAPSGSVLSATVTGGPLVGTPEGGCVAAALRGARVPAFDGEPVTAATLVHLR